MSPDSVKVESMRAAGCVPRAPLRLCRPFRLQHRKMRVQQKADLVCSGTSFKSAKGDITTSEKSHILVGTEATADLQIEGRNCYPKHAEIQRGKGRTTCTALIGDEDDLLADTYTWLDGNQLRTGVGYLLSPASTLAFGQLENEFIVDFEEAKTDTSTLEMLIKGMASQSSQEVRDQFDL